MSMSLVYVKRGHFFWQPFQTQAYLVLTLQEREDEGAKAAGCAGLYHAELPTAQPAPLGGARLQATIACWRSGGGGRPAPGCCPRVTSTRGGRYQRPGQEAKVPSAGPSGLVCHSGIGTSPGLLWTYDAASWSSNRSLS
jgi:hypothetical protein